MPEHVCAACPRAIGKSCCEVDDRHGLATVTGGDVARIRAATGLREDAFVDREAFTAAEAHAHAQLRPANAHAVVGGVRRHLRAREGRCVFHGPRGCTLDAETRPLACRLYPFEIDALGQPALVPSGACHAEASLDGPKSVLAAMDLTVRKLRALHARLCRELEADARPPR